MEGARRAIHRKDFKALQHISVKFADDYGQSEGAVDVGGPKRELFRLILKEMKHTSAFTGEEDAKMFSLNTEGSKSSKNDSISYYEFKNFEF